MFQGLPLSAHSLVVGLCVCTHFFRKKLLGWWLRQIVIISIWDCHSESLSCYISLPEWEHGLCSPRLLSSQAVISILCSVTEFQSDSGWLFPETFSHNCTSESYRQVIIKPFVHLINNLIKLYWKPVLFRAISKMR